LKHILKVIYQLKILTTAVMLRILLGKLISRIQWIALLILVSKPPLLDTLLEDEK